jgi:putative transposase
VDSAQLLTSLCQCLEPYLPLDLQGTRISASDLWYVLGYASVHATSIEASCTELAEAPSGNRVREVLQAALPAPRVLQRCLNGALRAQLPKVLLKGKRSYSLALDCTLIPYHGRAEDDDPDVLRAQAKSGTHHFHGYATVSIVHDRKRYILALRWVRPGETMVAIVRDLLNRVKRLGVQVRRVYLDKEFYGVAVFRTLQRRKLAYVLPLPMHGGLRRLCQGRRSHYTAYTLQSKAHGAYSLRIALVRRNRRSRRQRRVVRWFGFAVAGLPAGMDPRQVFQVYRHRFGIETSYRQMNQVRARTSSRNATLRLLLVGLALLLVNLYVQWRTRIGRRRSAGPRAVRQWMTLWQLARSLARAIETRFGIRPIERLQIASGFS